MQIPLIGKKETATDNEIFDNLDTHMESLEKAHMRDEDQMLDVHLKLEKILKDDGKMDLHDATPRDKYNFVYAETVATLNTHRVHIDKIMQKLIEGFEIEFQDNPKGSDELCREEFQTRLKKLEKFMDLSEKAFPKYRQQTFAECEEIAFKVWPGPLSKRMFNWVWNIFKSPFKLIFGR